MIQEGYTHSRVAQRGLCEECEPACVKNANQRPGRLELSNISYLRGGFSENQA